MATGTGAFTRRGFLTAGIAAAGTVALAGCSSPVSAGLVGSQLNPEQLIFWNLFGGGDGNRMQQMEAGYRKGHGGSGSLQATTFAWGNPYYSKLTLATVGNKPPDVAVSHLTRAKPLYDGGILEPITEDDLALVGLKASDFNAKSWAAQKTDGNNIAIPLDTHPIVMFYNEDVCRKAGLIGSDGKLKDLTGLDTFESALAAVSKVTGGNAITVANVSETATPWRVFWTFYNQINGVTPFLSDNGAKLSVDEDAFNKVNERMQTWVKNGWLNKGLDYAGAQTQMFTGKAGFYLEGEWEISTAQSIKGLKFGMVPIPQIFDKPAAQADSHTFVLPKKARTLDQRKQHMGFIKTMLEQSMTWAQGGHVPAYQPTATSAAYHKLEPQADYASAAKVAVYDNPAWYGGSGSTFEATVGAQLALVQQGSTSPQGAMSAIKQQLAVYLSTPSPL
ncbi:sugar ABC transporter substrate-binding protein [Curtobacterium sp. MCBD17_034]|uniref:extracellular solute-binding protein n=1 Tax=unclassified Curtobacterium TaxID=257496 RepID=UPI000DA81627|nr:MULTISPECIES: extracellular solute-binding protein [unclassified Curtobacterium]PZE77776.1 sugar ABC transporter substrate-binding protein [Curtobacterium sp. MCBD17_019]PZF62013.1 sugar ABC transporter substrate-binding protein [Curtobacterium sp. MCBD17_034]PZF63072.1 sugar ABC transporter substrate-binding protein [Curtobacterium sp. MCBD17_013]PZM34053.1 sugar ABC transporter substrate-binding protein [Curtobacterium sp. MCBD17_031]WIE54651.1 extracellular solute-binding protein [Curtob